jgi:hypothetical protein
MAITSAHAYTVAPTTYDLRKVTRLVDLGNSTVQVTFQGEPDTTFVFPKAAFEAALQASMNA